MLSYSECIGIRYIHLLALEAEPTDNSQFPQSSTFRVREQTDTRLKLHLHVTIVKGIEYVILPITSPVS